MLAVVAVFDTTIDDNFMELDRDGEFRLFIYGDVPVGGAEDRDDTIIIGVNGSGNVTIDTGGGASDQIFKAWSGGAPSGAGTVLASSVKAITVDAGDGVNTIDLSAVTSTDFTSLVDRRIILSGGSGVDTITGSDFGDVIGGLGGNDTIHGGDGDDLINGGDGADTIFGDDGDDVISGGDGNDTISAGSGLDVVDGNGYKDHQELGPLDTGTGTNELDEASGLVIGRTHPGVLWTIEDSKGGGSSENERLYANNKTNGNDLGYFTLDVNDNHDWEDLAYFKEGNTDWIYIGDIGDNNIGDNVQTTYRVEEPSSEPTSSGNHGTIAAADIDRIMIDYPMDKPDAEAMMVDPETGDIYIVTKREPSRDVAHLYKIDAVDDITGASNWKAINLTPPAKITVTDLGALDFPAVWTSGKDINSRFAISGMDISSDGLEVLLRTDRTIFHYKRASTATSILTMLRGDPVAVIAVYERGNRESIAFDNDSTDFYTVSEFDSNNSSHATSSNRFGSGGIVQEVHLYDLGAGTDTVSFDADLTNNGFVDFQDLTILLADWNKTGMVAGNIVNATQTPVDFGDLTVLLAEWTGPDPGGPSPPAGMVAHESTVPISGDPTVYSSLAKVTVNFTEKVLGVDPSDMVLTGTGTSGASISAVDEFLTGIWTFTITGLSIGTVDVTVAPDVNDITYDDGGASVDTLEWTFIAMPGVTFSSGALVIEGTSGDDTITAAAAGGDLTLNGAKVNLGSGDIAASAVTSILIEGYAGDDTIDLSAVTSTYFTGAGLNGNITIYGGSGSDTLTGSAFDDAIDGDQGTYIARWELNEIDASGNTPDWVGGYDGEIIDDPQVTAGGPSGDGYLTFDGGDDLTIDRVRVGDGSSKLREVRSVSVAIAA